MYHASSEPVYCKHVLLFHRCCNIAVTEDYEVEFDGIGIPPEDSSHLGFCSQMAIFRQKTSTTRDKLPNQDSSSYTEVKYSQYNTVVHV